MGMDIVDIVEMVEVVGIAMRVLGLILAVVICALPTWIETTFIATNFTNTGVVLYGLWMSCVTQGMGETQCGVYNSIGWYLPDVLQAARAMILTAIILGVLGVVVSMVGAKCANCVKDETSQDKLINFAEIQLILAGIIILTPVFLVAISIIDHSTQIERETVLGASLYFGWMAAALLLIGGSYEG
ncbi:claudin-4-like [Oncorhynchus masou masou]|uniref:claudin-4-like n=1 Tax=Oncorhynchus masou masou TaxID=90313 RepID=UPI0031844853